MTKSENFELVSGKTSFQFLYIDDNLDESVMCSDSDQLDKLVAYGSTSAFPGILRFLTFVWKTILIAILPSMANSSLSCTYC